MNQTFQAMEPTYLNTLFSCKANTINASTQKTLAHLMRCYGIVITDTLIKYKHKVCNVKYDLLEPLVNMYAQVEELEQLGIAAENPYLTV